MSIFTVHELPLCTPLPYIYISLKKNKYVVQNFSLRKIHRKITLQKSRFDNVIWPYFVSWYHIKNLNIKERHTFIDIDFCYSKKKFLVHLSALTSLEIRFLIHIRNMSAFHPFHLQTFILYLIVSMLANCESFHYVISFLQIKEIYK